MDDGCIQINKFEISWPPPIKYVQTLQGDLAILLERARSFSDRIGQAVCALNGWLPSGVFEEC